MFYSSSSHQSVGVARWPKLRDILHRGFTINPLLMFVGIIMILALVGTLIGLIVDHRVITGVPAWIKPAKFAISISIYSFTFLWLLSFIRGHKRLVGLAANVTALFYHGGNNRLCLVGRSNCGYSLAYAAHG